MAPKKIKLSHELQNQKIEPSCLKLNPNLSNQNPNFDLSNKHLFLTQSSSEIDKKILFNKNKSIENPGPSSQTYENNINQIVDNSSVCKFNYDIKTIENKPHHTSSSTKRIFCMNIYNSEDEDSENEFQLLFSHNLKSYSKTKLIREHKDAKQVSLFIKTFNFTKLENVYMQNETNFCKYLPIKLKLSPGWNNYHLKELVAYKINVFDKGLKLICKNYDLEKYYLIIFNFVRYNTFTYKNSHLSFAVCFHIFCYHLCKTWDLGKGKNFQLDDNDNIYRHFIHETNFHKLFKTENYWLKKAEILLEKARIRALKDLGIEKSTMLVSHLYKFLLLLPFKNSYEVAYICYAYHATETKNMPYDSKTVSQKTYDIDSVKNRKLHQIVDAYNKNMHSARQIFAKKSKIFEIDT
ncbi:hypothetical protein NUSPORA_02406 [Nucleospora cyclopteri]